MINDPDRDPVILFLEMPNSRLLHFITESFQFTHIGTEFKMHDGRLNQKENKNGSSFFTNVNHPLEAPSNLKYRASLGAASGSNLQVIVPAKSVQSNCTGNFVQFEDPYSRPVKTWKFCRFTDEVGSAEADVDVDVVILQSFLNTLNVLQVTGAGPSGMKFSMQVKSLPDEDIIQKVNKGHVAFNYLDLFYLVFRCSN